MSYLCDLNLTIIIKTFRQTPLTSVGFVEVDEKKNEIIGLIGSRLDSLLRRKSSESACRLIGENEMGVQVDPNNHTFSGALGLLQSQKGDLIFCSLSREFQKPWLMHSHTSSQNK